MKSGNLNFLEPSGPLEACNGTALINHQGVSTKLWWSKIALCGVPCFVLFTMQCWNYQIREREIGVACNVQGKSQMLKWSARGNLKEGFVFEGPGLDWKKTLHLPLNKIEECGLYSSAQDRDWRAVVNMVMNLSVSQTAGNFLTVPWS